MMKNNAIIFFFLLVIISCAGADQINDLHLESASNSISRFNSPHLAEVTSLAYGSDGTLFSADENGFVVSRKGDNIDSYQFSNLGIQEIAVHPTNGSIALYETDGFTIHRVSVWNWKTKTRTFFKVYTGEILSMYYSSKGTYLVLGSVSSQGVQFLNSRTGATVSLISENTGIISFTKTNDKETSLVAYSVTGRLSYYDLKTKKLRASFSTEQNLEDVVLYNNNLLLVGKKDNKIYKINAVSGEVLQIIPSSSDSLFFMNESSESILYAEKINSGYTLHFEDINGMLRENIQTNYIFSTAFRTQLGLVLGTTDGTLLYLNNKTDINVPALADSSSNQNDTSLTVTEQNLKDQTEVEPSPSTIAQVSQIPLGTELIILTQKNYKPILDFVVYNDIAHFITEDAYFQSNIQSGKSTNIKAISGYKSITPTDYGVLLWSKGERKPLSYISYQDTQVISQLYIPTDTIDSITVSGDSALIIDGGKVINVYNILQQAIMSTHTGTGFESAAVMGSTMYVAKSAATSPFSPLINIDMDTGETAAELKEDIGDVSYALTASDNILYGIMPKVSTTTKKTTVFSYNTTSKTLKTILTLSDEDADAELVYYDEKLFTTLGKNQVSILETERKSVKRIDRNAVLPKKVSPTKEYVFVLNMDGTLTVYNSNTLKTVATWYVDNLGQTVTD